MDITHWWSAATKQERQRVADACGIKRVYLYQLAIGFRKPSPQLARALDVATQGALAKEVLRPDVFGEAA
jgi:DNA-binding transcriptional regulator YdaS (Cro superfamily)